MYQNHIDRVSAICKRVATELSEGSQPPLDIYVSLQRSSFDDSCLIETLVCLKNGGIEGHYKSDEMQLSDLKNLSADEISRLVKVQVYSYLHPKANLTL